MFLYCGITTIMLNGKLEGRVVIMAHTKRHNVTHIISMREANAREQIVKSFGYILA